MKYCPMCLREYADSALSCPDHGSLTSAGPYFSVECELCGKLVEPGQKACANCGARLQVQGKAAKSVNLSSPIRAEAETAKPQTLRSEGQRFHFNDPRPDLNDPRPDRSKPRSRGVVLTAAAFIAFTAVGLLVLRGYSPKPAAVKSPQEQPASVPRLENPLPLEFSEPESQSLAANKSDKSITDIPLETESVTQETPLKSGNGKSAAKVMERTAIRSRRNSDEKRQNAEPNAQVSLKIPSGVRIPSAMELRNKRAQLESEQTTASRMLPSGVEIPSQQDIRRKRIEYEIEQAIQNRAIEGVSVSFIGATAYLSGQVETERQRAAAEQAARAVSAVGSIRSSISVRNTKG